VVGQQVAVLHHPGARRRGEVAGAVVGPAVDHQQLVDQRARQLGAGGDDARDGGRLVAGGQDHADGQPLRRFARGEILDGQVGRRPGARHHWTAIVPSMPERCPGTEQ